MAAYSAGLIRLFVFKTALIQIGPLRFKFAPQAGDANYVPFKTILPYLRGEPNALIAFLNVVGNIGLLAPIGFLAPFVHRGMTWRTSLTLAVGAGIAIEGMEVGFSVGIFDIDDVILNAVGVVIGYWAFTVLVKQPRSRLEPS